MGEGDEGAGRRDAPGRVRDDEAAGAGAGDGGQGRKGWRANGEKKEDPAAQAAEADAEADADADADGEIDDSVLTNTSPHAALPSRTPDYARPDRIPLVDAGGTSDDVFVSTGLDGTVLLWDRRVSEGEGAVRRWDGYEAPQGERGKSEGKSGGRCTSVSRRAHTFSPSAEPDQALC